MVLVDAVEQLGGLRVVVAGRGLEVGFLDLTVLARLQQSSSTDIGSLLVLRSAWPPPAPTTACRAHRATALVAAARWRRFRLCRAGFVRAPRSAHLNDDARSRDPVPPFCGRLLRLQQRQQIDSGRRRKACEQHGAILKGPPRSAAVHCKLPIGLASVVPRHEALKDKAFPGLWPHPHPANYRLAAAKLARCPPSFLARPCGPHCPCRTPMLRGTKTSGEVFDMLRPLVIAPSILASDFSKLGEEVRSVDRGRRRLDPPRRHGRPFRAEHLVRPGRHQGDAAAFDEGVRHAPDDHALRSLSRGVRQGRLRHHHRACGGRPAPASLAAGDPRARQEGRRLAQSRRRPRPPSST